MTVSENNDELCIYFHTGKAWSGTVIVSQPLLPLLPFFP